MYKIELLPIAKEDIDNILHYISLNLKNKTASRNLRKAFMNGINNIAEFPYNYPIYKSIYTLIGVLEYEYRSYKIKNFLMFYTINEKEKIVVILRVLYQKMNISKIL